MLDCLLWLRKKYAIGKQNDYFDDQHIVGWTSENGLACLMSNQNMGGKRMYLGLEFAGQVFYDAMHHIDKKVIIDSEGYGDFEVLGGSVSVYIPAMNNDE